MFLKPGLFSLIFLVSLLPQAQSSRSRFVTSRSHAHHRKPGHHHASSSQHSPLTSSSQLHELPKPHIQMVTRSNGKHSQYADFDIAMVTVRPHIHQVPDQLGTMLDTPVSGPNPGGNSQGLYVSGPCSRGSSAKDLASKLDNMLDTPVSGPNPGGNSAPLGNMLYTPVSGPNLGGNSPILRAVSGPNLGGNLQILATSSGPNPGGNSEIQAASSLRKDGVSMVSSSSLSLGSNLSKNFAKSGTFRRPSMSRKAEPGTLFDELPRTPVPPSGPSPIHN